MDGIADVVWLGPDVLEEDILAIGSGTKGFRFKVYVDPTCKREGDDQEAIERLFTPEFRNRMDATISFLPLARETIGFVVDKFIKQLEAQLADRGVTIELSPEARDWLGRHGYDENFGARPLARVIQEHIKKPLADELLFGDLVGGGRARVVVEEDDKLGFEFVTRDFLKGDTKKTKRAKKKPKAKVTR